MKKFLSILLISFVIISCGSQADKSSSQQQGEEIQSIDPANLETIEIAVSGMTCGGCESTVQKAVANLPGVQSVKASHMDSSAKVTYDKTKSTFDDMQAAISSKGYEAAGYIVLE